MSDPWEEASKLYTIHEESRCFTQTLAMNSLKPFHEYTLEEARQVLPDAFKTTGGETSFDGQVEEISIPSPYSADGIPASVYKPSNCATTPAILVYFHGGGLLLLDRKCLETALKIIAKDAGCIVVNVEYRLLPCPGHCHAPFDDGVVATRWVLGNKERVGGRPDSKVGVGGDSAGGQIAASLTYDVSGLDFQVLVYPNTDMSFTQPSVEELPNAPGLSKLDVQWFMKLIKQELPDYLTDPRVNVMARTNPEVSPPTLVLVAQLDILRDSGLVYGEKLRAAGVKVRIVVIEGVPHCFFGMCDIFKTKCQEAFGHVVQFIQEFQ